MNGAAAWAPTLPRTVMNTSHAHRMRRARRAVSRCIVLDSAFFGTPKRPSLQSLSPGNDNSRGLEGRLKMDGDLVRSGSEFESRGGKTGLIQKWTRIVRESERFLWKAQCTRGE